MSDCQWCPLLPSEARAVILAAAEAGRDHGLGRQCWHCQRTEWGLKCLNLPLREIDTRRARTMSAVPAAGTQPICGQTKAPIRP